MATALLAMRQHRLATTRDMVKMSQEIEEDRQTSWHLQMKIEKQLEKKQFHQALSNAAVRLESSAAPAAPAIMSNPPMIRTAEHATEPRTATNVAAAN